MDAKQKTQLKERNTLITTGIIVGVLLIGVFTWDDESSTEANKEGIKKEVVYNSEWDGSVSQVEKYLKSNLKDPDSYEGVDWSAVHMDSVNHTFMVRHKYRAKNSFGGFVVDNKVFYLDSLGNIYNVTDFQ